MVGCETRLLSPATMTQLVIIWTRKSVKYFASSALWLFLLMNTQFLFKAKLTVPDITLARTVDASMPVAAVPKRAVNRVKSVRSTAAEDMDAALYLSMFA